MKKQNDEVKKQNDEVKKQNEDVKKQNDDLMTKMINNETSMASLIEEVKALMNKS